MPDALPRLPHHAVLPHRLRHARSRDAPRLAQHSDVIASLFHVRADYFHLCGHYLASHAHELEQVRVKGLLLDSRHGDDAATDFRVPFLDNCADQGDLLPPGPRQEKAKRLCRLQ